MGSSRHAQAQLAENDEAPHILFSPSSFGPAQQPIQDAAETSASAGNAARLHRRRFSRSGGHDARHIQLQALPKSSTSSIYMGSYSRSPRRSRSSLKSLGASAPGTPRHSISHHSISHSHLESLLRDLNLDLETYGVEELRDGFFDAAFFKPHRVDHDGLMKDAKFTLPDSFKKNHPLSAKYFLPNQLHAINKVARDVITTRAGIKLMKSFLGFFIAYILCLIPAVQAWLGRFSYIMVLSTLINHPGRTIGAQIDGAVLTTVGTAAGLGWGAFALWLSDSTAAARNGYGGILAAFLAIFMGTIAALRTYYIRVYQLVLSAGMAVLYTCLENTSQAVAWGKLFDYGIPWVLGQAVALLICCIVFPDAGARPLAVALHEAFRVMKEGLVLPQPDHARSHRHLASTFVSMSTAYRDLVLDITVTRFRPSDVMGLRNLVQAVIRSLLSLRTETHMFDEMDTKLETQKDQSSDGESIIEIDGSEHRPSISRANSEERAAKLVVNKLADPTSELLSCMRDSLERCDAVLMGMSGYRKYLGPPESISSDLVGVLTKIRQVCIKYDEEIESLMDSPLLPTTYSDHPQVVELFLFAHPIRQAANSVEALLVKVMEMQQRRRGWRLYLPSYSFSKALQRTNAQVRHDRGGVTAGDYFRSQWTLARTMRGMANVYQPLPRHEDSTGKEDDPFPGISRADTLGKYEEEEEAVRDHQSESSRRQRLRYRIWSILHGLQGFEMRFALKVVIVMSLLSVPAWLEQSREWWDENDSWWGVVLAWIMFHPRVGGNFQDLVTRGLCVVLGAAWGAITYGARNGNPYVMAVLAAIYMIPMLYRFTQSTHPRSGIVGCISFVIVSLSAKAENGLPSVTHIAWTRGAAFVVGVLAAVVVNWILWPFVARHELRKALSSMMMYSSIIYRGVVAKYVYYEKGEEPGKEDIERSEMLEGRLREGFVRIRQLMGLTRHEIRLRAPFDPLPYSGLIAATERFFEYLISVRQSSLFFHPHFISDDNFAAAESLLSYRRDAVAAILMNLYVLAGALRNNRPVPRYLPSAALARKRLLDKMAEVESAREMERVRSGESDAKRWGQIYSYSYSQGLTGCVKELEELIRYTKEIVGERGFDIIDGFEYEDIIAERR